MAAFGLPGGGEIWIIFCGCFVMVPAGLIALIVWLVARGKSASVAPVPPANWAADPTARHELRYWDGSAWTAHISDAGVQSEDPL